jgi:hypothetical protein
MDQTAILPRDRIRVGPDLPGAAGMDLIARQQEPSSRFPGCEEDAISARIRGQIRDAVEAHMNLEAGSLGFGQVHLPTVVEDLLNREVPITGMKPMKIGDHEEDLVGNVESSMLTYGRRHMRIIHPE